MNHRRPWWIVFSLLPPLIALCALVIPFGCGKGGSSTATPVPTTASVAVALVGVAPAGNFRSVLLNISGVRINQAANAAASDPGWVTIAVPTAAGSGNGQNPGDLQLDLLHSQTGATFFNVAGAPPGTYQTAQVLVDPNNPGTIVPACPSGVSNTEGCINYPLRFGNSLVPVIFSLGTPLAVSNNATAPLVIQLGVSVAPPANTGNPYVVAITPSEVNFGSFLATVNGSIKLTGTGGGIHLAPLSVSAELSGTNIVIETVPVRKKDVYTLELPAAPGGTSYDIFTNGAGFTFAALQGITVSPGQLLTVPDLAATAATASTLSGLVADGCTGLGIPGAQLELLAPASPQPKPRPTPPASFCFTNPNQCVIVASASADQAGNYPMPGTSRSPAEFAQIPVGQPDLAVLVSASGYTSLPSSAFVKTSKVEICSGASVISSTQCNFSLTTGFINGTVNLVSDPPPGNSTVVQVFAENSGTNQLESALPQPLVFLNHETSLPFTLNVPILGGSFDLFAVAIDPFQGGPDPFPGHDIPVLANLTGPTSGCKASTVNAPAFAAMNCVGHGSISGTVQNPDIDTTVEVEKQGVQILGTSPALFSSNNPGNPGNTAYTLCVPPDNYALQRFEAAPASSGTASATPIAVGTPQAVTIPQPAATSSPCPSTCSNSNSGPGPCPGICNATAASPL